MRGFFALAAVILAIAAAVFFADRPGSATLIWQGWRIDSSVAVLLLIVVIVSTLFWTLLSGILRLISAPGRMTQRRREARRLLAYRTVTDGLVAIAAGDVKAAERLRLRAEHLFLKSGHAAPPLTRLLAAQAALLRGDTPAATGEFTAMLESPETEFLGLRGLIVQALKSGDDATALKLTARANRLRPATAWVLQSQLALETRAGEWRRADDTLREAVKRKAITAEQGRHHRLALMLARSRDATRDGRPRDAVNLAAAAHKIDPAFAPAAVEYAALLNDRGQTKRALKVVETCWARGSHPTLAAAYDRLLSSVAPADRLQRFERLAAVRDTGIEGRLAAASIALAARLWGEARRHLDAAGADGPGPWPRRLCHLMAELEDGEQKDPAAARRWLDRAQRCPPDEVWVCAACGAETAHWDPLCPTCQSFDALAWRTPDRSAARVPDTPTMAPASVLQILELESPAFGNPASRPDGRTGVATASSASADGVATEEAARGSGA